MRTLILLRHGQSEWNASNQFTGWVDCALTAQGIDEAVAGGVLLADAGLLPDVLHTSLQTRAIHTAELALRQMDRSWIPVHRTWRLNERHYGALQGLDKDETRAKHGAKQVHIWRRSYDVPPPNGESLEMTAARTIPYLTDVIMPALESGNNIFVAAHGNSLRSIIMHIDGLSREEVLSLEVPTGQPIFYRLENGVLSALTRP